MCQKCNESVLYSWLLFNRMATFRRWRNIMSTILYLKIDWSLDWMKSFLRDKKIEPVYMTKNSLFFFVSEYNKMLYKEEHICISFNIVFLCGMSNDHTIHSSRAACVICNHNLLKVKLLYVRKGMQILWTQEKQFRNMFTSSILIKIFHIHLT